MAEAGFTDSVTDARAYLSAGSDGRMSDDEIDTYVRTAPEAVRFLCSAPQATRGSPRIQARSLRVT
ncbi:MAG: hypothetical protein L0I76_00960 [Pseudonocardia sp.]|nr:hypothetical protein [Pseudonocardia sp.]